MSLLAVGLLFTAAAADPAVPPSPTDPEPVVPSSADPAPIAPVPVAPADPSPVEPPPLTPEELAAIEAALAADTAATAATTPPAPAPAAPAAGGSGQNRQFQSMNPDMSVILDVVAAAFTADEPLQTGGHDPRVDGFNLQQVEISLAESVDPYLRFDSNLVFSLFGVEIEEAYATTLTLPLRTQLRVGQFLTRFGRLNNTHPHTWSFVDQPFAIGRVFGAEANRGLGVEGSVLLPLPWYVEVVGSSNMNGGEATNRSWLDAADDSVRTPSDLHTTAAVKQFFALAPDWSLAWGLSYAGAPNGTGRGNRAEVFGTDVYLRYRPIRVGSWTWATLESEWLYRRRQVPGDLLSDLSGYTQGTWKLSRRWGVGARWEYGTPARNLDGEVADDPLDPYWTAARHRTTAAVTFWPSHFSRVRLQPGADWLGWQESPELAAFVQFEVLTGAHGSHPF
jgi:hypothetical protein